MTVSPLKRSIALTSALALILALGLSACGSTHAERGLSGAGIGAAAGAAGAAVIGAPILGGAAVGAAAGAATGILTDRRDLDLDIF